ncbi:hypothetical protein QF047_000064 [Arthrobacter sp. W4I7]|nr:hypothetical protein [Arthrobacter sp. W4I7]
MSNRTPLSVASDQSRRSHIGNWPDPCLHTSAVGPTRNT